MKHKIKMLCFDLDGTLLTSDKKLTERTEKALIQASEKGIFLLPVTGRPLAGLPKVIKEFPYVRYAITSNGARIIDLKDETSIYEEVMDRETAEKILDILGKYDTLREVYYCGTGYAESRQIADVEHYMADPAMAEYVRTTRIPVENIMEHFYSDKRNADKIQGLFGDIDEKNRAWKELEESIDAEITGALNNNIEIMASGVHKGKALLLMAEKYGIDTDEIMAFGDGGNDISMIETAGVGVAMANGIDRLREAADLVTDSNDSDGVAKVIEKYIL